jgi:6-phosphogluconolactonase/glucosamine-6-phosphate isomerase/deaminase
MFEDIELLFKKENTLFHKNQGITVASVSNSTEGIDLASQVLYKVIDRKTVLYLSGGGTPKSLYTKLAREEALFPGAVGQVDERYGPRLHGSSNQLMMRETGILRYFEMVGIPFYPMLQDKERRETAEEYDQKMRELNAVYPKSAAIMGIGKDGHTAGVPTLSSKSKVKSLKLYDDYSLVADYNYEGSFYGERVTVTFLGLSMLDLMLVLVFGEDKKKALTVMFEDGSEEEVPARFYKRPDIARKTLLITDQRV